MTVDAISPQRLRLAALPRWAVLVAVFAAALIARALVTANTDVSWGLTMAEKWLDGARLYVDVIEVNPPATVFLYVVPAWLSRLIGLRAEICVDALVFMAAFASLAASAHILRRARLFETVSADALLTLAAVAIMVLPAHTFGEREHVALIAFLPVLAVMTVRAEGRVPTWPMIFVAALGGGFVVIIKPYLALALVTTALAAAFYARQWRVVLAPENVLAAGLLALYTAVVLIAFPEFTANVVPLLMLVYVPVKDDWLSLFTRVATPLWLGVMALTARLMRRAVLAPSYGLLLAASIGFGGAFYVQQKGWPYHSYPMIALALIGLGLAVVRLRRDGNREWVPAGCAMAGIAVVAFSWFNLSDSRQALATAIRGMMPNPKIIQLSVDLSVSFPLTRQVNGTWVGRTCGLWMTLGAEYRRDTQALDAGTRARLDAVEAYDRRLLTEDIARERPDLVLVQRSVGFDMLAWANADPALAAELKAYREDRTVGDIIVLRRIGDG